MLRHILLFEYADKIQNAIFQVLKEGQYLTKDLGGNAMTTEYTEAIIKYL